MTSEWNFGIGGLSLHAVLLWWGKKSSVLGIKLHTSAFFFSAFLNEPNLVTLVRNFRRIIISAYSLSVVFNIKSSELCYFLSWARMAGPFLSASASCSLPLLSVAIYSVVNLKLPGMYWLGIGLKVRSSQTFCGAPAKLETCKRKKKMNSGKEKPGSWAEEATKKTLSCLNFSG